MAADAQSSDHPIVRLIAVMAGLRDKGGGCPWDLEQTFASIAPYTVEEAYEVADAIERGNLADLKEELGDLLLQVIYHAQMAAEAGAFDFAEVAEATADKMIRRHPHVFGEGEARSAAEQTSAWEALKAEERAAKSPVAAGLLDGIAVALPALTRAAKLSKRAAGVGFAWPSMTEVLEKLEEEIAELRVELAAGDMAKAREELGDILFVCANVARELDVDPEAALRGANAKFTRRFAFMEARLREAGRSPSAASLAEKEELWRAAKAAERREAAPVADDGRLDGSSGFESVGDFGDDRR
ncbi:MAG: nucleoside triphosphate pyrophosphohydrolase [Caulobacteraceae bacterium]